MNKKANLLWRMGMAASGWGMKEYIYLFNKSIKETITADGNIL